MPHLEEIQLLADSAKNELGFLPTMAYRTHALRGQLWVAVNSEGSPFGYLLFGGKFPQLKVFQLFVRKEARGSGTARELVEKLIRYAKENNYQYISARVATELRANRFWSDAGFQIINQLHQAEQRRTLNVYSYWLEENSLFSASNKSTTEYNYLNATQLRSSSYALDLNVYFDIAKSRTHSEDALKIVGLAMTGQVQISITQEFARELMRNTRRGQPDPALQFSLSMPTLPKIPEPLQSKLIGTLRPIVFPDRSSTGRTAIQDDSDLTHLAACIYHGISGFVTRENALLQAAEELRAKFGLDVLAPWEFVDADTPATLLANDFEIETQNSILTVEEMNANSQREINDLLVRSGLHPQDVVKHLSSGNSLDPNIRLVAREKSRILGFISHLTSRLGGDTEAFILIDENSHHADRITDHFTQILEKSLPVKKFCHISITLLKNQFSTIETLRNKGFHNSTQGYANSFQTKFGKWCFSGPVVSRYWPDFSKKYREISGIELPLTMPNFKELTHTGLFVENVFNGDRTSITLRNFETMTSSFLIAEDRPFVIVPIRLGYANRLLGTVNKQHYLNLSSSEALMLSEKAYFSNPNASSRYSSGAILLFYVSGADGGNKAIVGMARATLAKRMSVESARTALRRQGVLDQEDLEAIGRHQGDLFALTFDTYIEFPHEVSYDTMKELNCVGGANLVTAQQISHSDVDSLVNLGFGES